MSDEPEPAHLGEAEEWRANAAAHYAAIGRVAESWASLELHMDWVSWTLASVHSDAGACMTSQIAGPSRKVDAMIALARLRRAPELLVKEMNDFAKRMLETSERRNRVIHDPWLFPADGKPPTRYNVTARRVLHAKLVEVPTPELESLAVSIEALFDEVTRFMIAARELPLPPSPDV